MILRSEWLSRKVGQVVLVVIDALRADFVFADSTLDKMGVILDINGKKTEKRRRRPKITVLTDWIQNSNPLVKAFVAKVHSPTVTMPRIKVRTQCGNLWIFLLLKFYVKLMMLVILDPI